VYRYRWRHELVERQHHLGLQEQASAGQRGSAQGVAIVGVQATMHTLCCIPHAHDAEKKLLPTMLTTELSLP
jgi:hypothetical protein